MRDALDVDVIHRSLSDETRQLLERIDVLNEVSSTNTWMMEQALRRAGRFEVVLAEKQTAGRGRYHRRWQSPPRSGLCMTIGYTFDSAPGQLASLTLVVGAAVARALTRLGARGHKLKWPNDLMAGEHKLGGILTDALTSNGGNITVVIGIGLNLDLRAAHADGPLADVGQPVTDLASCTDTALSRCGVAAAVIDEVRRAVSRFELEGLEPFRHDWNAYDWLRGRNTVVELPDGTFRGVADGIDASGALRILTEHGRRRVYTGSVRLAEAAVPAP